MKAVSACCHHRYLSVTNNAKEKLYTHLTLFQTATASSFHSSDQLTYQMSSRTSHQQRDKQKVSTRIAHRNTMTGTSLNLPKVQNSYILREEWEMLSNFQPTNDYVSMEAPNALVPCETQMMPMLRMCTRTVTPAWWYWQILWQLLYSYEVLRILSLAATALATLHQRSQLRGSFLQQIPDQISTWVPLKR